MPVKLSVQWEWPVGCWKDGLIPNDFVTVKCHFSDIAEARLLARSLSQWIPFPLNMPNMLKWQFNQGFLHSVFVLFSSSSEPFLNVLDRKSSRLSDISVHPSWNTKTFQDTLFIQLRTFACCWWGEVLLVVHFHGALSLQKPWEEESGKRILYLW